MIMLWVMNYMGGIIGGKHSLRFNNPSGINNSMYIAVIPF